METIKSTSMETIKSTPKELQNQPVQETIKSTHTGKQSEKSLGVMLFPMEGSYEYVKTI